MKKTLPAILLLLALCVTALADPLVLTDDLSGTLTFPEGADPAGARYVYTYRYPRAAGDEEAARAVNAYYEYEVTDAEVYRVPMWGEEVPEGAQQRMDISYRITCSNDDYFSVLITAVDSWEGVDYAVLSAQVFARQTEKAGSMITLPYLLGILAEKEEDTWLQTRQTEKADACVRGLILDMIARNPSAYAEDVDDELLSQIFYPEEDFYLDEEGNPVFFIQTGYIAPEEAGPQFFPIDLDELLDEI